MKSGKSHRVPLSPRALAILGEARGLSDSETGLVFPAPRSGKKISDMAFTQLVRRLCLDFVPHGLRSSFQGLDGGADQLRATKSSEAALAHSVSNATEAAYLRSDFFDQRRGSDGRVEQFPEGR